MQVGYSLLAFWPLYSHLLAYYCSSTLLTNNKIKAFLFVIVALVVGAFPYYRLTQEPHLPESDSIEIPQPYSIEIPSFPINVKRSPPNNDINIECILYVVPVLDKGELEDRLPVDKRFLYSTVVALRQDLYRALLGCKDKARRVLREKMCGRVEYDLRGSTVQASRFQGGVLLIIGGEPYSGQRGLNVECADIAKMEVDSKTILADDEMETIYESLRITGARVVGGPFSAGDLVTVAYELTNTSDTGLRIPLDNSFSRPFNLVGTRQHWIERKGDEKTIPGIPPRIRRKGSKYAVGGSIVSTKPTLGAGESLSFQQRVKTNQYPAGRYTYYIEYQRVRDGILQMVKVDFELAQEQ